MARGSERETPAQQTRANAARDGKCNSEGAVRKGRGIARRYQSTQSQRANGRETEKLNLRWHACRACTSCVVPLQPTRLPLQGRRILECRHSVIDNVCVIPRIRELLHSPPFQPFLVQTSDGREYSVSTSDDAAIHPPGSYVVIFSDDDSHTDVAGLHVASVVKKTFI